MATKKNNHELSKYLRDSQENQQSLNKKFKKLKHHITYLNMEYDELFNVFKYAKETFISNMFAYCSDNKITSPFSQNKDKKSKSKKQDKQQVKDLFREIVKQTHPDKTKDLPEEEVEARAELYQEATEGKMSGDFNKILKVALELDIEINNINFELIETLEQAISKMEDKINNIEKDVMYRWYYSTPENQTSIFNQITKSCKPIEPN